MKKMTTYISEVRFLGFKLKSHEVFEYTNLEHAKASEDMILRTIRPIFRPFCYVVWHPSN